MTDDIHYRKQIKISIISILLFCIIIILAYSIPISFYIVQSHSMSGEIERGDIVAVQNVDISTIQCGDNIAYYDNQNHIVIIHKVFDININNQIELKTGGIYPEIKFDNFSTTKENFIGKVVYNNQFIGKIILNIFPVAFFILLFYCIKKVFFTKKFRKNQHF